MGTEARWHVYLLRTRRGTLYTGIALDVPRRIAEHAAGTGRGAKYLRAMSPLRLEYSVPVGSHRTALQTEARMKKLPRARKEEIVRTQPGTGELLARLRVAVE